MELCSSFHSLSLPIVLIGLPIFLRIAFLRCRISFTPPNMIGVRNLLPLGPGLRLPIRVPGRRLPLLDLLYFGIISFDNYGMYALTFPGSLFLIL